MSYKKYIPSVELSKLVTKVECSINRILYAEQGVEELTRQELIGILGSVVEELALLREHINTAAAEDILNG